MPKTKTTTINPIRAFRNAAGLTQEALSKMLGVSRVTVARWEIGSRLVSENMLMHIYRKCGLPPAVVRPDLAAKRAMFDIVK